MTTVPTSVISMSDIQTAFGLGNNLNAYYSARWYKDDNSRGYFQAAAGNSISFSDFAGKRNTSPVVPSPAGGVVYNGSQSITIPQFNYLTVTVKGGNGGTHGVGGNCNGGGDGGPGGDTSFGTYVTGAGGGVNGGTGTTNTRSWAITDANQASIIALYGTIPYGTVGAGGGAGSTGYNSRDISVCYAGHWTGYGGYWQCDGAYAYSVCDQATGGGSGGAAGYIKLEWS